MNKRIIASILTVIMLMTMLPTAAFAADGESTETGNSTTPEAAIYLDQQHGADDNDGLSKTTAVKTIEKANELANEKNIKDICLSSFYQVTGTETWDLGGKTLHRYGLGGYMIELVSASASLTLSNIVIDGAECTVDATHAAETDSIIKAANGGTIVLNSGAILQNNKAMQFGSGVLANNGVNITMEDGAIIRNNTNRNYELGGGILIGNGSTFTMNGGEISGNTANGGGGVAIIGSTMVMNNGTISNNSTYQTSGQGSYGAGVYVADYANSSGGDTLFTATPASFEMNGGKITGNKALDYGGGIVTFPQRSQKITINIKNGEISGNKVTRGSGGAVAAFFGVTELNIKDGTLTGNSAYQFGGGVFLYQATNVTISGGTISKNKALRSGGGVCLREGSAVKQTGGSIENNVAKVGGGIYSGTYTMTGGVIKDNNNSLTEEARLSTLGDGVFVGTAFNLGNDAEISTNNDVYLVQGTSVPKEGRYINDTVFTHFAEHFYELKGKTWGIIGLGNIGRRVSAIAEAFGAEVIYTSPSGSAPQEGYHQVDLDTLLAESDIISVHAPLNQYTENLINESALKKMKKTCIFLNLGRGPIVNEQDLADALMQGEIAAAGLDVLCQEPMSSDNPLMAIKDSRKLF